jgi:malate synthase
MIPKEKQDIRFDAPKVAGQDVILTEASIAFLAGLEQKFGARRRSLLQDRVSLQKKLDAGQKT